MTKGSIITVDSPPSQSGKTIIYRLVYSIIYVNKKKSNIREGIFFLKLRTGFDEHFCEICLDLFYVHNITDRSLKLKNPVFVFCNMQVMISVGNYEIHCIESKILDGISPPPPLELNVP